MRRTLIPLVLAALLLTSGCGDEGPHTAGQAASTTTATPTAAASAPPSAAPTSTNTAPTGPLAGFPLDLGYDAENGDDHSPVAVTAEPATKAFGLCGTPVWEPLHGTTDVIGVEFRGEAEWARGRTLVLYPTEAAAVDAVTAGHDAVAGCPEDRADDAGNATAHTLLDVSLGDQSVIWVDRFRSADAGGHFDTGLVVYHLVRVGRAVLMSYEYGEGNGSSESRDQSIAEATEADRPVVDKMRDLVVVPPPIGDPIGDAYTLTAAGGMPFELGMTEKELRAAAPDARLRDHGSSCGELSWTAWNGALVHGAVSREGRLVQLSVSSAGTTAEGITVGSTQEELRAAYPQLDQERPGAPAGVWLGRQPNGLDTFYEFDFDGSGRVSVLMVVVDGQRCAE